MHGTGEAVGERLLWFVRRQTDEMNAPDQSGINHRSHGFPRGRSVTSVERNIEVPGRVGGHEGPAPCEFAQPSGLVDEPPLAALFGPMTSVQPQPYSRQGEDENRGSK